jgi:hypothetical protein
MSITIWRLPVWQSLLGGDVEIPTWMAEQNCTCLCAQKWPKIPAVGPGSSAQAGGRGDFMRLSSDTAARYYQPRTGTLERDCLARTGASLAGIRQDLLGETIDTLPGEVTCRVFI